jgi:hypothetical protein
VPQVVVDQVVEAPQQQVWDAVTDWEAQSQWVMGTTVTAGPGGAQGVGGTLEAVTGVRSLGVRDPMVVVEWDPPHRCVVEHRGAVVRGRGIIEVIALTDRRSQLMWVEDLELPFGVVGRLGWPLASSLTAWGVGRSLRRFAALVEARESDRRSPGAG